MKTKISIALLFLSLMGWGQNDSVSGTIRVILMIKDGQVITKMVIAD